MEEKSIALEMLEELKRSNKRNFFIIVILIIMLLVSNGAWLLYLNGFEYEADITENYTQTLENNDNSITTQTIK